MSASAVIVNERDSDGRTALHRAAAAGRLDLVEDATRHGAATDTKDDGGWRPLHSAASAGHTEVVAFLLGPSGGDIEVNSRVDGSGSTALIFAASKGHADVLHVLIDAKADLLATDASKATALHRAAGRGHALIIPILINAMRHHAGAIEERDVNGQTAFHVACTMEEWSACIALAENGADITTVDNEGNAAAMLLSPSLRNQLGLVEKEEEGEAMQD